jgi:DNA-binding NarL/FixJ family response regulator
VLAARDRETVDRLGHLVGGKSGLKIEEVVIGSGHLVEAAQRHRPDTVILDLGLTDELAVLLAALAPVPVLAVAGEELALKSVVDLAEAGVRGVMGTGDQNCDTIAAVRTVVDGGYWMSSTLGGGLLLSLSTHDPGMPAAAGQPARGALTAREIDVLNLILDGYSNAEIADRLFISRNTAKYHVRNLLVKFAARDRAHLIAIGYRTARNYPSGWGRQVAT